MEMDIKDYYFYENLNKKKLKYVYYYIDLYHHINHKISILIKFEIYFSFKSLIEYISSLNKKNIFLFI